DVELGICANERESLVEEGEFALAIDDGQVANQARPSGRELASSLLGEILRVSERKVHAILEPSVALALQVDQIQERARFLRRVVGERHCDEQDRKLQLSMGNHEVVSSATQ